MRNELGRALLVAKWDVARFTNHLIKPIRSSNVKKKKERMLRTVQWSPCFQKEKGEAKEEAERGRRREGRWS